MTPSPPSLPDALRALAARPGVELREAEPLARHVSMGVGGPAHWMLIAEDVDALAAALAIVRAEKLPWMILGGGSNSFFSDTGYPGVILKLGKGFRSIVPGPGPGQLTAGAAANLSAAMNAAKRAGLAGLEWAAGVPGQVGGALAGNAGTGTGDACGNLAWAEVLDAAGRRVTRRQGQFDYRYRWSALGREVILSATWDLTPDDPAAIQIRIDAGLAKRMTQPVGQRCSGCMFKNPQGEAAGRLIDQAGLKGLRVGGARVAAEHANFIVNDGTATAADILALAGEVRRRVRERFGVELDLEIRMIGLDSEETMP